MKTKPLYIIIASQDFESANHHNLWLEMAEQSGEDVLVCNIHADHVVSRLKHKTYRIKEAKSAPVRKSEHLRVMRPLLWIRQELLPESMYWMARKGFWDSVTKVIPDVMSREVKLLVYNACWVPILYGSHPNMKIGYYLFDEVRYSDNECHINKKTYRHDEFACKYSDVVFTMTKVLTQSRSVYNKNIITLGNGSILPNDDKLPAIRFDRSIAFIGVFRDWIDNDLLYNLISRRPDILFSFAGPVNPNMEEFFHRILNDFDNTMYLGVVPKDRMTMLYRKFSGVIIPYQRNAFIQATRPIKIVESVMAGTPVVTMPMDGYDECEYIRFANNIDEFSDQIDYIINHPIDRDSPLYKDFVRENTWREKASVILKNL